MLSLPRQCQTRWPSLSPTAVSPPSTALTASRLTTSGGSDSLPESRATGSGICQRRAPSDPTACTHACRGGNGPHDAKPPEPDVPIGPGDKDGFCDGAAGFAGPALVPTRSTAFCALPAPQPTAILATATAGKPTAARRDPHMHTSMRRRGLDAWRDDSRPVAHPALAV